MRYTWIDEYLLSKPGVTKDLQAEWNWIRYKIGDRMFAAILLDDADRPVYINLKLDPVEGEFLRGQYADIIPGYYSNKRCWNSVRPDGAVPDELLRGLLDKSYALVLAGFSKKKAAGADRRHMKAPRPPWPRRFARLPLLALPVYIPCVVKDGAVPVVGQHLPGLAHREIVAVQEALVVGHVKRPIQRAHGEPLDAIADLPAAALGEEVIPRVARDADDLGVYARLVLHAPQRHVVGAVAVANDALGHHPFAAVAHQQEHLVAVEHDAARAASDCACHGESPSLSGSTSV